MCRGRAVLAVLAAVLLGTVAAAHGSDAASLTEVARLKLDRQAWAIAWSWDGSQLAALVGNDVETWDTATWAEAHRFTVLRRAHVGQSLAYVGDGLLVGAPDQIPPYNGLADAYVPSSTLVIWDPTAGSPLQRFPDPAQRWPDGPTHVQDVFSVSSDGAQIAATDAMPLDPVVFIYDTATGRILHSVRAPPVPRPPPLYAPSEPDSRIQEIFSAIAFSPSGHTIAACGYSGRVYLIDSAAGAIVRIFQAYAEGVRCSATAFSGDGELLATGRVARQYAPIGRPIAPGERMTLEPDTGNVRVWDVASGGMVASFSNAVGTTRALSWSRSGRTLAAGDDGMLNEWTFAGATVSSHASLPIAARIFGTDFSTDGRLAVLRDDQLIGVYK